MLVFEDFELFLSDIIAAGSLTSTYLCFIFKVFLFFFLNRPISKLRRSRTNE